MNRIENDSALSLRFVFGFGYAKREISTGTDASSAAQFKILLAGEIRLNWLFLFHALTMQCQAFQVFSGQVIYLEQTPWICKIVLARDAA